MDTQLNENEKSEKKTNVHENQTNFFKKVLEKNEYDALKHRHENQTLLLSKLTNIDLRLFFGYLTAQFVVASFIITNSIQFGFFERLGILFIDIALTLVIFNLLERNFIRRKEVIEIVKNCNTALGYNEINLYLKNKALDVKTLIKPWFKDIGYKFGLIITSVGFMLILFLPFLIELIQTGCLPLYLK